MKQKRTQTPAKWEALVKIELSLPVEAQEVPVFWPNRALLKNSLEVDLGKKCAMSKLL